MNITEVNIKLVQSPNSRLRAFCTLTLNDEIVIRDVKIIEGTKGPFVAMPSRKLMDRCPKCSNKNHLRARYCNNCGAELRPDRATIDEEGRPRLHVDVAHPINSQSRGALQDRVLTAYNEELERSRQPGYQPMSVAPDMDYDMYSDSSSHSSSPAPAQTEAADEEENSEGFGEGIL